MEKVRLYRTVVGLFMEQLLVFANERVVYGCHASAHGAKFQSMAWLSTLKGNEKAEDMIVYYALWIGSTKITPVAGMI